MSQSEEIALPRKLFSISLPTALSLLTALVALGTVTLHLIGDVSHRQYLKFWGIDAGLFPKATDWVLINGYYGVVDRFVAILLAMLRNLHWLAAAAVILGVYLFVLLSPASGAPGKVPSWLLRQAEWRRRLFRNLLLTGVFVSVAPCALFLFTAFMVVPAALGETAGKAAAENEASEYKKGCNKSRIPCVELKADGKVLVEGFILDSSPSHIAIFDARLQNGRVIALEKLEVVAHSVPRLLPP